jgi:hypothetical protein
MAPQGKAQKAGVEAGRAEVASGPESARATRRPWRSASAGSRAGRHGRRRHRRRTGGPGRHGANLSCRAPGLGRDATEEMSDGLSGSYGKEPSHGASFLGPVDRDCLNVR